jgi:hypothetical protein
MTGILIPMTGISSAMTGMLSAMTGISSAMTPPPIPKRRLAFCELDSLAVDDRGDFQRAAEGFGFAERPEIHFEQLALDLLVDPAELVERKLPGSNL